jgi:glycosyltransferase involved in cell wall biosynthesis
VTSSFVPVARCRIRPTPVFLISFNRGAMLERTIRAIRRLSRATEIVIHDNGSTCPFTLAVLDDCERSGTKVFRYPAIHSPEELNQVNETVSGYFADWAEPGRYVVSDCDVDMSIADSRVLDVYDELLNTHRKAECVGPMLRIRDIPRAYPLFNRVMNRHIDQFWRHAPDIASTSFGEVAILPARIDTTFALHRAGEPFRRLKSGLRVYEPFEALHLDWYHPQIDHRSSAYAATSDPQISHWGNVEEVAKHRGEALRFSEYYAVRKIDNGRIQLYTQRVPADAG